MPAVNSRDDALDSDILLLDGNLRHHRDIRAEGPMHSNPASPPHHRWPPASRFPHPDLSAASRSTVAFSWGLREKVQTKDDGIGACRGSELIHHGLRHLRGMGMAHRAPPKNRHLLAGYCGFPAGNHRGHKSVRLRLRWTDARYPEKLIASKALPARIGLPTMRCTQERGRLSGPNPTSTR